MSNPNPRTDHLSPFQPGQSGNPNGRPKGRKSLAAIIRELEDEEFDWSQFPKQNKRLQDFIEKVAPMGSPLRAIVYRALLDATTGEGAEKSSAREWLRKAGYGDKLDVTTDGEKIQSPLIISTIPGRHVEAESETAESN